MAPLIRTESFRPTVGDDEVQSRVRAWFEHLDHKVVTETPGNLEITSGS